MKLLTRRLVNFRLMQFVMFSCLLPCVLCGCTSRGQAAPNHSSLSDEQLAVYAGLLDSLSQAGFKSLAATTITFDPSELKPNNPCLQGLVLETSSDSLQSVHVLNAELAKNRQLAVVDSRQQATLVESADRAKAQLGKSNDPTPTEHGFLALSEIAFDKTHQFALLKYKFTCGAHCSTSQTFLMEKADKGWRVKGRPCTMIVN